MYKKRINDGDWFKHLDFTIIDILSLEIAFMISCILRLGQGLSYYAPIYQVLGIMLPIFHIFIVFFTEEYAGILRRGDLKELKIVVNHNSILLALVLFYIFAMKQSADYSRIILFAMWALGCLLMYTARIILKRHLFHSYKQKKNLSYMVIVTTKSLLGSTIEHFQTIKYRNYIVKGIVVVDADMANANAKGIPIVANGVNLMEYVRTNVVDEIFINIRNKHEEVENIAKQLLDMGITVHINLVNLDRICSGMTNKVVEEINGYTVVTTSIKMATGRQLFLTRVMDIWGGLLGLAATIIAFIIFAPIIYIQSPGSIFFKQERVGLNGRHFRIYKFRSMYMDAEERKKALLDQNKMTGLMFKMDDDPRIIPIGAFIRRFSIDELPQSLNVLKGDMSLVGTRPPTVTEYDKYELYHKRRLATKPGLTGMWQVSGRSDITDFEEVVKLDAEYICNWSLGLYIKILLKTVGVVLGRKGSG